MSIRTRILAGFLIVVAVMGSLTVYALGQLGSANSRVKQMVSNDFSSFSQIANIQHLGDQSVTNAVLLLYGPKDSIATTLAQLSRARSSSMTPLRPSASWTCPARSVASTTRSSPRRAA